MNKVEDKSANESQRSIYGLVMIAMMVIKKIPMKSSIIAHTGVIERDPPRTTHQIAPTLDSSCDWLSDWARKIKIEALDKKKVKIY